ncbi:MAG: hypothetical protein GC168_15770 [Candidatus Hydrogenedens sp.]|nr:hypothetical protein [Candidatus Hydrogenedens sp.]
MSGRIFHASLWSVIVITGVTGAVAVSAAPPEGDAPEMPPILLLLEEADLQPKCPCEIESGDGWVSVRDKGDAIYTVHSGRVQFRWDMQYQSNAPPRFAPTISKEEVEAFTRNLLRLLESGAPRDGVLTKYESTSYPDGRIVARTSHRYGGLESDSGVTVTFHEETGRLKDFYYTAFQKPASMELRYTEEQVTAMLQNYVKDGLKFFPPELFIRPIHEGTLSRGRSHAVIVWSTGTYRGEPTDSCPCEAITIDAQTGEWTHMAFGCGC